MIWVAWRQQRTETLIAAAILALLAALLIPTGHLDVSAYHNDGLASCLARRQGRQLLDADSASSTRSSRPSAPRHWFTLCRA